MSGGGFIVSLFLVLSCEIFCVHGFPIGYGYVPPFPDYGFGYDYYDYGNPFYWGGCCDDLPLLPPPLPPPIVTYDDVPDCNLLPIESTNDVVDTGRNYVRPRVNNIPLPDENEIVVPARRENKIWSSLHSTIQKPDTYDITNTHSSFDTHERKVNEVFDNPSSSSVHKQPDIEPNKRENSVMENEVVEENSRGNVDYIFGEPDEDAETTEKPEQEIIDVATTEASVELQVTTKSSGWGFFGGW